MWNILHQPGTNDINLGLTAGMLLSVRLVLPKVTVDWRRIKCYVSIQHNLNTKVISYVLCPLSIMLKVELNPESGKQTKKQNDCLFSIFLVFFA